MKHNSLFVFLVLFGLSVPIMYGMRKKLWKPVLSTTWPTIRRWFGKFPHQTIFNVNKPRITGRVQQFFTKKNLQRKYKNLKPKVNETIARIKKNPQYQEFKTVSDRMQAEKWKRRKESTEKHFPRVPEYWRNISTKLKQFAPPLKFDPSLPY